MIEKIKYRFGLALIAVAVLVLAIATLYVVGPYTAFKNIMFMIAALAVIKFICDYYQR